MRRSVCALGLLLATYTAVAAPAPKEAWHQVDPDRDCKFSRKDSTEILELPGTDHDLAPKRKRFNAPRLLREVEGDFLIQVRVSGCFHPSAKSTVEGENPSVAAGLVLIPADDNCIRMEFEAYCRNGEHLNCPVIRMRGERIANMFTELQVPWKPEPTAAKETQMYLSLERRREFICEAYSSVGKKCTHAFKVRVKDLPGKVKVGFAAYSTSTEPFKATFDELKLIKGERKGRAPPGISFETKFVR